MKQSFKLTNEDIKIRQENALELFYSGIKADQTRRTMDQNLKKFLVEACADLFTGDYAERSREFVDTVKEDQEKATAIVLAYVRRLRQRTMLEKSDPFYLNPSTLPNKIKPIKKLVEMNGLALAWKRIHAAYPELDNTYQGRGYTREEIKKLLEHSESISTDFIILATSSGGLRLGAWKGLTWKDVFPIYKVDGEYKVELAKGDEKEGKIVCGGMTVYHGSPEEYVALVSLEAWQKLQEYKKIWINKVKREPKDSDPLILEKFSKPTPLTEKAVKSKIEKLLIKSGLRTPLTEGKRRHEVPAVHGFRRYWDKIMMQKQRKRGTLSALVIKERLLGHEGLVKTDKNYFWTNIVDLVPEYLGAMPELIIDEEIRLKKKLKKERAENKRLEQVNNEKGQALKRLSELEAKVERMQRYQIK